MVTFTTMTRFVDEERTHAGIFKALGYRSKDIISKFLLYGLVAGTVGTALGSILWTLFTSRCDFKCHYKRHGGGRNPDSVLLEL